MKFSYYLFSSLCLSPLDQYLLFVVVETEPKIFLYCHFDRAMRRISFMNYLSFFIFSLISFIVSLQWHKINKISWLHFVKQVTHRKFNSMKPVCQKYTMNSDEEKNKNKNTFGNFVNCVLTALRQPQLRSMKQFRHCWNWL